MAKKKLTPEERERFRHERAARDKRLERFRELLLRADADLAQRKSV